jgi:hypothetical protein
VKIVHSIELSLECDVDALRAEFPKETDGLSDRAAIIDAYENGIREPLIHVTEL